MLCTGGDTGGGLRGRGVAQAVLRLRGRQHLDDDLHCPVLRLRSHQERLLLQVRLQPYEYKYPDMIESIFLGVTQTHGDPPKLCRNRSERNPKTTKLTLLQQEMLTP